jgi:hypothetical protein
MIARKVKIIMPSMAKPIGKSVLYITSTPSIKKSNVNPVFNNSKIMIDRSTISNSKVLLTLLVQVKAIS